MEIKINAVWRTPTRASENIVLETLVPPYTGARFMTPNSDAEPYRADWYREIGCVDTNIEAYELIKGRPVTDQEVAKWTFRSVEEVRAERSKIKRSSKNANL